MDKVKSFVSSHKDEVLILVAIGLVLWFGYDAVSGYLLREPVADNLSSETQQRIERILGSN